MDQLGQFGRWLALIFGGLLLLAGSRSDSGFQPASGTGLQRPTTPGQAGRAATAEYVGELVLTVAGMMLVAGAGDLVLLFVGLELISIPTYVLLYFGRDDAARQEATVKYFFLSVLSSAVLLYGFSFLYGLAGSTDLAAVRHALAAPRQRPPRPAGSRNWRWPWCLPDSASGSPPCRSTFMPRTSTRAPPTQTRRCYRSFPRRPDFWCWSGS